MVILWTDYFVYLILLMVIAFGLRLYFNPVFSRVWHKVIYRPLNVVAILIIIFYSLIGLLDSIHFDQGKNLKEGKSGIVSVLDEMLSPLSSQKEYTYSKPFAIYSFTKENRLVHGEVVRDYPRLTYGGAHLPSVTQKWQDIGKRLGRVFIESFIFFSAFAIVLLLIGCYRHQLPWEIFSKKVLIGKTLFPYRAFLATIALFIFFVVLIHDFKSYYHILGTSQIGEDVLYQALKSVRTGLIIGTLTTLLMLPFAILFGMMAGYFRGWIDDGIQYTYTTLNSIPGVLLIAAAVLTMQLVMDRHTEWFKTVVHRADIRLLVLCIILGITSWTGLCRLLRGEVLKLSQMDYVQAAQSLGVSHFKIMSKHLLPNVMHIVLISIALDFSGLVLAEAVLSYVGVGVDPTSYSWGIMINSARLEMAREPLVWWSLMAAFIFMFVLVLSANIVADAIRDAFDPHTHYVRAI